jgi:hypothetical protein
MSTPPGLRTPNRSRCPTPIDGAVGRPLKSPEPAFDPRLGLEPLSRLSPALLTIRNAKVLLSLAEYFTASPEKTDLLKIPRLLLERFTDVLCYAA